MSFKQQETDDSLDERGDHVLDEFGLVECTSIIVFAFPLEIIE